MGDTPFSFSPGMLSTLFMSNQPTQTGQPQGGMFQPITAPQSLIGQLDMSKMPVQPAAPLEPVGKAGDTKPSYQPSQASQIAGLINSQFGKK